MQLTFLFASLVAIPLAAPALAQCTPWEAGFHVPDLSGAATAFTEFDDGTGSALFVAGDFDEAGGVPAARIAKFDGAGWASVGSGIEGWVRAFAVFDDGDGARLYAAGQFTLAGGQPASNIARWDGAQWQALGSGLDDEAFALAVHDDGSGPALYVGGKFAVAGGLSSPKVARWNGAWSAVGGPNAFAVHAFEVFDDGAGPKLYAGGQKLLHQWTGSGWVALTPGFNGIVNALEVHDDGSGATLFAGGTFASFGGPLLNGCARWNGGTNWTPLGPGASGALSTLFSFDDGTGAALYADAQVWRPATGWQTAGDSVVTASAFGSFDFGAGPRLIVGTATEGTLAGEALWGVAKLDNGSWSRFTNTGNGLSGAARAFVAGDIGQGDSLYAGGTFRRAGTEFCGKVARWNGATWERLGAALYGDINALAIHDAGAGAQLFAAGINVLSQTPYAVAAWNGNAWQTVGTLCGTGFFHGGVYSLAVFDGGSGAQLYAGGDLCGSPPSPSFTPDGYLARWNGTTWQFIASTNQTVSELLVYDDGSGPALYAGGEFTQIGGVTANYLARFDGTTWSAVGSGPGGWSQALAVHDDGSGPALYVANLRYYGPNDIDRAISKWDGSAWTDIGVWEDFGAADLTSFDDGNGQALFAAGGQGSEGRIKVWRNGAWSDVPGTPTGDSYDVFVSELFVHDDGQSPQGSLWIGGSFRQLGAVVSRGVGRYSNACACHVASYCTSGTTSSGCTPTISASGQASADNSTDFALTVTSVEGDKQGHLFYGISGAHSAPWGSSTHFLCVKAPSQRTGTQPTGGVAGQCNGMLTLDWDQYVATHPTALGVPFGVGQEVRAQAYFRDPAGPKTTALSDGLVFTICP